MIRLLALKIGYDRFIFADGASVCGSAAPSDEELEEDLSKCSKLLDGDVIKDAVNSSLNDTTATHISDMNGELDGDTDIDGEDTRQR